MSERPTPDEVIEAWWLDVDLADTPTDALKRHGYGVAHRDDHPFQQPPDEIWDWDSGGAFMWGQDAMRRSIFGNTP